MFKSILFALAIMFIYTPTFGGLPPTTSQDSSDTGNVTTFNYQFPNFAGTHTGVTFSLGLLSVAGGGTGQGSNLIQYGIPYNVSTTAMGSTGAGTTGQVLTATTGGAPGWNAVSVATNPLVFTQTATPSNPSSGFDSLYFKSDN